MTRRSLVDRLRSIDTQIVDFALAAALTVVCVGSLFAASQYEDQLRETDALAVALGLATTVPLFWRRRAPLAALVVSSAAITALIGLDYASNQLSIAVLFLTYATGSYLPLRRAALGLATVVVALFAIWLTDSRELDTGSFVLNLALFTGAWLAGVAMRSRSTAAAARLAEAEERAEAHRQQAARSVAEERLRIAQELHDVVAHSMSVIAVQAGMGVHVIDQQPAEAKKALAAISSTSRATLHEMRRLLGVLRGEDGDRSHVPAPGLDDLPALVDQVRSTGLAVELTIDGKPHDVPLGVDLSAYRLVQEGLTNVIKHAGPAHAVVHVRYQPGAVVVEVCDDGRGAAAATHENGGHGLVGMRERVAVWGGTLAAGPAPGGGYRVLAHLPYGDTT